MLTCSTTRSTPPLVSIIDDDPSVREAMDGLVTSLGYGAWTFASAEEFLRSDHMNDTSCVITDVQMPGLRRLGQITASIFGVVPQANRAADKKKRFSYSSRSP